MEILSLKKYLILLLLFSLPFILLVPAWNYPTYYDGYSETTRNLAEKFFYSSDGKTPSMRQQPPGFSIMSVPFHYLVGYPKAVKLSGCFWTALAAMFLYLLSKELGLKKKSFLISLLFIMNPWVIRYGVVFGVSESVSFFFIILGFYLLVLYKKKKVPVFYLLSGLSFGMGVITRYTLAGFLIAFWIFSFFNFKKWRKWLIIAGLIISIVPLGSWVVRNTTTGEVRSTAKRYTSNVGKAGAGAVAGTTRGPTTAKIKLLTIEAFKYLVSDVAKTYLLFLPLIYLGVAILLVKYKVYRFSILTLMLLGCSLYLGMHIIYGVAQPRYVIPLLPCLLLIGVNGLKTFLREKYLTVSLLFILASYIVISLPFNYGKVQDIYDKIIPIKISMKSQDLARAEEMIAWVNKNLPENSVIVDCSGENWPEYRSDMLIRKEINNNILDEYIKISNNQVYLVSYDKDTHQRPYYVKVIESPENTILTIQYYRCDWDEIGSILGRRRTIPILWVERVFNDLHIDKVFATKKPTVIIYHLKRKNK